ncbi:hypothetical protein D3C83_270180 [compost metagenome]
MHDADSWLFSMSLISPDYDWQLVCATLSIGYGDTITDNANAASEVPVPDC